MSSKESKQQIETETQTPDEIKTAAQAKSEADPSMERVRQILFGSQMRDYDRRLREVGERLDGEIQHLRQEQHTRGDRMEAFIRVELERLHAELRREREERLAAQQQQSDKIETLGREITGQIDALRAALGDETRAREAALLAQSSEVLDALEERARTLTETLQRERDRLQDEKTNRDELAQLFSELALRLNRELSLPEA